MRTDESSENRGTAPPIPMSQPQQQPTQHHHTQLMLAGSQLAGVRLHTSTNAKGCSWNALLILSLISSSPCYSSKTFHSSLLFSRPSSSSSSNRPKPSSSQPPCNSPTPHTPLTLLMPPKLHKWLKQHRLLRPQPNNKPTSNNSSLLNKTRLSKPLSWLYLSRSSSPPRYERSATTVW